jgi:hypothetical protein
LEGVLPEVTHPRLRNLLAFWEARRGDHSLPACEALDPLALWEWLGHLMLVEAADGGDFRYRVYGTGLAEYLGRDLTGKTTAVLRSDVRDVVCREYAAVCRTARPLLVVHRRRIREQVMPVEKLILPFSSDGRTVDRLLAGAYPAGRA